MGKTKISLKELASVRRKFIEPIDDYLNRFRLLKARCFTQVLEHELVEMAIGGLDYSIRKKLDTQYLRDMAKLADRVRRVERLKEEKDRTNKVKRVAYVDFRKDHEDSGFEVPDFDDTEIDLAELTHGPPYACKVLAPSNRRNPVEPEKNDRFPKKTYTFDVMKCDEIFDLLVKDVQMIVPSGAKMPPLEQRKKRGFCKYHGFLGHKMSQCFLFRDRVQNAIQEGRLKFGDKPRSQIKIDSDPLQIVEDHYIAREEVNFIEVADDFCMIEVIEDFVHEPVVVKVHEYFEQAPRDGLALRGTEDIEKENVEASDIEDARNSKLVMITKETADSFIQLDKATGGLQKQFQKLAITEDIHMEVNMVEVSREVSMEVNDEGKQEEYNKVSFLEEEETLSDFLRRCQKKKLKVMLCPR